MTATVTRIRPPAGENALHAFDGSAFGDVVTVYEQPLLGALIEQPSLVKTVPVLARLQPEHFFRPAHAAILDAVRAVADEPGAMWVQVRDHLVIAGVKAPDRDWAPYLFALYERADRVQPAALPHFVARIMEAAARRQAAELGAGLAQRARSEMPVDDLLAEAESRLAVARSEVAGLAPRNWQPVELDAFVDGTWTPPEATVLCRRDGVGLLYPGRLHLLAGEPEAGKSWLALLACAQLVRAGRPVAYVDYEDGPDGIVARLLALGCTPEAVLAYFRYYRPDRPLDAAFAAEVAECALVAVDAATEMLSAAGLSPKDDVDIAAAYRPLREVAARGPAVLLGDHVIKDAEARGRWATGSQHKLAGLDGAAFQLESVRPFGRGVADGRSRLYLTKDRLGGVAGLAVRSAGERRWLADFTLTSTAADTAAAELWAPVSDAGPFRPTQVMARVADVLERHGSLSLRGVQDRVGGKQDTVRQAVTFLIDDGFVVVDPGPRGAHLHRLVRPYPEGDL